MYTLPPWAWWILAVSGTAFALAWLLGRKSHQQAGPKPAVKAPRPRWRVSINPALGLTVEQDNGTLAERSDYNLVFPVIELDTRWNLYGHFLLYGWGNTRIHGADRAIQLPFGPRGGVIVSRVYLDNGRGADYPFAVEVTLMVGHQEITLAWKKPQDDDEKTWPIREMTYRNTAASDKAVPLVLDQLKLQSVLNTLGFYYPR